MALRNEISHVATYPLQSILQRLEELQQLLQKFARFGDKFVWGAKFLNKIAHLIRKSGETPVWPDSCDKTISGWHCDIP